MVKTSPSYKLEYHISSRTHMYKHSPLIQFTCNQSCVFLIIKERGETTGEKGWTDSKEWVNESCICLIMMTHWFKSVCHNLSDEWRYLTRSGHFWFLPASIKFLLFVALDPAALCVCVSESVCASLHVHLYVCDCLSGVLVKSCCWCIWTLYAFKKKKV